MTLQPDQLITTNAGIPVVLRNTGRHGLGVFAVETIRLNTRIDTFSGERMIPISHDFRFLLPRPTDAATGNRSTCGCGRWPRLYRMSYGFGMSYDKCADLVLSGLIRVDDPLQIDNRLYLILEGISYYFNHSCDPNAGFRNESDLFAIRDISAGEEIRYDYSSVVSPAVPISVWIMECGCGVANCRQRIGHVLTLPPEQIALYLKHGAFQTYMLNELQQLGVLLGNHKGLGKAKHSLTHSWLSPFCEARTSAGGKGIFAKAALNAGDIICIQGGHVMGSHDEPVFSNGGDFAIHIADGFALGTKYEHELEDTDYFNHSCEPNAGWKGQIFLVAMRDIEADEEVRFDYATVVSLEGYDFSCLCGAPGCRGRVTCRDWMIPELQKKYEGWFQWYLQEKINKLKSPAK